MLKKRPLDPVPTAEQFERALASIEPREREIIEARYSLDGEEAVEYRVLSEKFGVTKERIIQIERKAGRKLAHPSRGVKLPFPADEPPR